MVGEYKLLEERFSRKFEIVAVKFKKKLRGFDREEFERSLYSELARNIPCQTGEVDSRISSMSDADLLPLLHRSFSTVKQDFISRLEIKARGRKKKA